jgi:hypothetical protein
MDEFNFPMQEATTCNQQSTNLLKHLWGIDTSLELDAMLDVQPYLEYYRKECCHALHDAGRHVICRKHSDIIEIAKEILDGRSKESLKNQHGSDSTEPKPQNLDTRIDASIDLTARLVSMIDIGPLQFGVSAGRKFTWESGSLQDLINRHFTQPADREANVRLERNFKGCNLRRNAGIKIVWTSNLADHLRITDEEVAIFHHASFLKHHRKRSVLHSSSLTLYKLTSQWDISTRICGRDFEYTSSSVPPERQRNNAMAKKAEKAIVTMYRPTIEQMSLSERSRPAD